MIKRIEKGNNMEKTSILKDVSTTASNSSVSDTILGSSATNCVTLGTGGFLSGYHGYPQYNYSTATINKVANGYTVVIGGQTFVFQTVKTLTKFLTKELSEKNKK